MSELGRSIQAAVVWQNFEAEVREKNRYFPRRELGIDRFLEVAQRFVLDLPSADYFRGRVMPHHRERGDEWDPFSLDEMGAPPPEKAAGGRLNPPHIPYLYLASDADTAVAEVRPFKSAHVSVARFEPVGRSRVLDVRTAMTPVDEQVSLLDFFGHMASRPVHDGDPLRYIATQALSEALKSVGCDGIVYESSLGPGFNVALFNPVAARAVEVELREVTSISVRSSVVTQPEGW